MRSTQRRLPPTRSPRAPHLPQASPRARLLSLRSPRAQLLPARLPSVPLLSLFAQRARLLAPLAPRPRLPSPLAPRLRFPVTLLLLALFAGAAAQEAPRRALVQAHRGFSEAYPENTLLAFEKAIEAGADRIETDLALTKDGVVVLMHDNTVDRTTDGQGGVAAFTLEELKRLDAGSWKSPEFAGERVPTLAEALELTAGRAELNLEIKSNGRTRSSVRATIAAAAAVILEHDALDRVVFSSFDYEALLRVREHLPEARLLLLDWDAPSEFGWLDVAIAQGFYGWSPRSEYLTFERAQHAKEAGLFIHTGAVSNPNMPMWFEWGVDGFSANDTAALVGNLERLGLR